MYQTYVDNNFILYNKNSNHTEKTEKDMDKSIVNLINQKIEGIYLKILDLSRRYPLISTTFSIRSNSHIRVVNEQPNFLFKTQKNNERLKLAHLPPLDVNL